MLPRFVGFVGAAVVLAAGLACQPAAAAAGKPKPKATAAVEPAAKPGIGIETQAKHALIIEVETGAVLLDKGADERIPPASMSKIMTAYVVFGMLKEGRAGSTDELPVSEQAWRLQGSKMFVPIGGKHLDRRSVARRDHPVRQRCLPRPRRRPRRQRGGLCRADEPEGQRDRARTTVISPMSAAFPTPTTG